MDKNGANGAWCFFGVIITFLFFAIADRSVLDSLRSNFNWNAVAAIATVLAVCVSLYLAVVAFKREDRHKKQVRAESRDLLLLLCQPVIEEIEMNLETFFCEIENSRHLFPFQQDINRKSLFENIEDCIIKSQNQIERITTMNVLVIIFRGVYNDILNLSFSNALTQIHRISDLDSTSAEELLYIMGELSVLQEKYKYLEGQIEKFPKIYTFSARLTANYIVESSCDLHSILKNFIARNYKD